MTKVKIDKRRWECPYCGKDHPSPNGTGTDVACCGEIVHAEPVDPEEGGV